MPQYEPRAEMPSDLDAFTRSYLETAEWCGIDDEQRQDFEDAVAPKWVKLEGVIQDCKDFQEHYAELLSGIDATQAGHDFYLTRNRHGAGFWDRGLGEVGRKLTEAAHIYGETNVWFDLETEELTEE